MSDYKLYHGEYDECSYITKEWLLEEVYYCDDTIVFNCSVEEYERLRNNPNIFDENIDVEILDYEQFFDGEIYTESDFKNACAGKHYLFNKNESEFSESPLEYMLGLNSYFKYNDVLLSRHRVIDIEIINSTTNLFKYDITDKQFEEVDSAQGEYLLFKDSEKYIVAFAKSDFEDFLKHDSNIKEEDNTCQEVFFYAKDMKDVLQKFKFEGPGISKIVSEDIFKYNLNEFDELDFSKCNQLTKAEIDFIRLHYFEKVEKGDIKFPSSYSSNSSKDTKDSII